MKTSFQITGLKKLQSRAKKLDANLRQRVYSKAVREAAKASVLDEIRAKVPVRTGALKGSIVVRANNKPSRYLFGVKIAPRGDYASQRTAKRRGVGAEYHPDWVARYYRFQELGTKYHAAKPFLKPGLQASAPEFLNSLRRELAEGIERSLQ